LENPISPLLNKERLDELFTLYHHRSFVHPDPLEFLYGYPKLQDREIVALIASSLAYGRVAQILKSTASVLERMSKSPFSFLHKSSRKQLFSLFSDFKHRFTTGEELASMLWGVKHVLKEYGSLHDCFVSTLNDEDDILLPALSRFMALLRKNMPIVRNSLLPLPEKGSACKRLNLFLRWMVRKDDVDPGGWSHVPASKLIIPLDTHMHKIGLMLHLTGRKQADIRTAIEITHAFRSIAPEDPVRYDFALTRLGIRGEIEPETFAKACGSRGCKGPTF
jgi:uncharacterized protein (TIGR02757 family)